ncbi:MAG: hypothetical protein IPH53_12390 [Flavobacteriales bacterium]|nr:hypothetical protein [Flavobacteriales bacterium]
MAQTTHPPPRTAAPIGPQRPLGAPCARAYGLRIGLYGLVRFVATGNGATADAYPSLEQRHLSAR